MPAATLCGIPVGRQRLRDLNWLIAKLVKPVLRAGRASRTATDDPNGSLTIDQRRGESAVLALLGRDDLASHVSRKFNHFDMDLKGAECRAGQRACGSEVSGCLVV